MEYIIFAVAIIAAFFAGAYVRKPFAVIKKEQPAKEEERKQPEAEEIKDKIYEDFLKLMSYTGKKDGDQ